MRRKLQERADAHRMHIWSRTAYWMKRASVGARGCQIRAFPHSLGQKQPTRQQPSSAVCIA